MNQANEEQLKEIEPIRTRALSGVWRTTFIVFITVALLLVINQLFQIKLLGFLLIDTAYYYYLIALLLPWVYVYYPAGKKVSSVQVPWYDALLFLATLIIATYFGINGLNIISFGWEFAAPTMPTAMAVIFWILVIEAARRTSGWILAIMISIFSLLPLYTQFLPWILRGQSFDFGTTARSHVMGSGSIIGLPLTTFASLMIGFIIFGVVLLNSGGGDFFLKLAQALLGKVRGGSAKIAILASAFFGMMSGSAVSNVLTTGSVTIHAMKKNGYSPLYAGATEACASTGGVVTPPIMGATAFVMANFLGLSYVDIVIAATIPALLYYWGLFVQIDAYAAKNNIKALEDEQIPSFWSTLREGWVYLFSLVLLVYFLLYLRIEAWAPFFASAFLLIMAFFNKNSPLKMRQLPNLVQDTGKVLVELICILAAIGLIIGALSITGVASSFSREMVMLVGNNVLLMLVAGALACFILGMGMTITAVYIFLAIVMAPSLITLGINPLAAHFFILYWGIVSFITPPVALASFAAAGIAKASPMRTGFISTKMGFSMYLVPFVFVFNPALLFQGSLFEVIYSFSFAFLAIFILASAFQGYMLVIGSLHMAERIALFAIGLSIIFPNVTIALIGTGIFVLLFFLLRFRKVKQAATQYL